MFSSFFSICSSNGREARNRAEKNRRDKLNKSIQELAGRVRNVAGSSKRIDKTGILRFSAHGLRIEYGKFNHNRQSFAWNANGNFSTFLY